MIILSGLTLKPPYLNLGFRKRGKVWEINVFKLGMDANGNDGQGLHPMKSVLILD